MPSRVPVRIIVGLVVGMIGAFTAGRLTCPSRLVECPYCEGQQAAKEGRPAADNPHAPAFMDHDSPYMRWHTGWFEKGILLRAKGD
jgi:hypothetical protein